MAHRSQSQRILWLLAASFPSWTPAPELGKISLQFCARLHELRRAGWLIENRIEQEGTKKRSFYRLGSRPNPRKGNLKKVRGKLHQIAVSGQAPSMLLRSQENENETESEQEHEQEKEFEIGKGTREGRGGPGERETILSGNGGTLQEKKQKPTPPSKGKAQEGQDLQLLQSELALYKKQHRGTEINEVRALQIVCSKTHIPFEYGQRLLQQDGGN